MSMIKTWLHAHQWAMDQIDHVSDLEEQKLALMQEIADFQAEQAMEQDEPMEEVQ